MSVAPAALRRTSEFSATRATSRSISSQYGLRGTPIRTPRRSGGGKEAVPVIAECNRATSATVRAIGPTVSRSLARGRSPSSEYSFPPKVVGRSPTVPHRAEGIRTEPAVSLPRPAGTMRAAIAAAVPPLDPPATRRGSYGFPTKPVTGLLEVPPPASSCIFALAKNTAP